MEEQVRAILFEAYEHAYPPKTSDWFWILGIFTIAIAIASILLSNPLFGILIFVGGLITALLATREPQIISYAITQRGVRIDNTLYPYSTLECFYIEEEGEFGSELFLRSEKMFMPLIIIPLPEDTQEEIEEMIAQRLPEKHIEKPFAHILLDFLKF